ncbi:MAG: sigma-70 family RNA polymerase sigma factor [Anaerolineales bacterium]
MTSQTGIDPPELVRRVADGDRAAFLELYDRYAAKVYGLALYITKSPSVAEEVSQETFVKLWTSADTFREGRGRVSSWLLTIARRTAIDQFRKQSRRPDIAESVDIEADWNLDLQEPLTATEESRWRTMYFALQELPREQRQAIILSYYYGLSHSEIASHLEIPLGTAKTRIRLGMQKLRENWFGASADRSKPS